MLCASMPSRTLGRFSSTSFALDYEIPTVDSAAGSSQGRVSTSLAPTTPGSLSVKGWQAVKPGSCLLTSFGGDGRRATSASQVDAGAAAMGEETD